MSYCCLLQCLLPSYGFRYYGVLASFMRRKLCSISVVFCSLSRGNGARLSRCQFLWSVSITCVVVNVVLPAHSLFTTTLPTPYPVFHGSPCKVFRLSLLLVLWFVVRGEVVCLVHLILLFVLPRLPSLLAYWSISTFRSQRKALSAAMVMSLRDPSHAFK